MHIAYTLVGMTQCVKNFCVCFVWYNNSKLLLVLLGFVVSVCLYTFIALLGISHTYFKYRFKVFNVFNALMFSSLGALFVWKDVDVLK